MPRAEGVGDPAATAGQDPGGTGTTGTGTTGTGTTGTGTTGTGTDRDEGEPDGTEPDVRFTYANERTFLAWNRTALALIATGVAATQLLPKLHVVGGRRMLGLPLVALGAVVAAASFRHWRANERAMRHGQPLPGSPMPLILAGGVVVVAVLAVVLAAMGGP